MTNLFTLATNKCRSVQPKPPEGRDDSISLPFFVVKSRVYEDLKLEKIWLGDIWVTSKVNIVY